MTSQLKCTDHMAEQALITQLSGADHTAEQVLITWLSRC